METTTPIQSKIESYVTTFRGYDRKNTSRTPLNLRNSEIGLQIALANMDAHDMKIDDYTTLCFSPQLQRMIDNFETAGIPLSVITDATGFSQAFKSAFRAGSASQGLAKEMFYMPAAESIAGILQTFHSLPGKGVGNALDDLLGPKDKFQYAWGSPQ